MVGKRNPRFLKQVIAAIQELRESTGSSSRQIMDQVRYQLNQVGSFGPRPRNVVMNVRRALRHAVETGMLVHRAGKYRIVTAGKVLPTSGRCMQCKRRGRGGRRRRRRSRSRGKRRRRRRRHGAADDSLEQGGDHHRCRNHNCRRCGHQKRRKAPTKRTRRTRKVTTKQKNDKQQQQQQRVPDQASANATQKSNENDKTIEESLDNTRASSNNKNLKRSGEGKPVPFVRQSTPHPKTGDSGSNAGGSTTRGNNRKRVPPPSQTPRRSKQPRTGAQDDLENDRMSRSPTRERDQCLLSDNSGTNLKDLRKSPERHDSSYIN